MLFVAGAAFVVFYTIFTNTYTNYMVFDSKPSTGRPAPEGCVVEQVTFDHTWSHSDLDLLTF